MEKIFQVPAGQEGKSSQQVLAEGTVLLKNRHLVISAEVADNAFGDEIQVYVVYYAQSGMLIMAPMSDITFKQAHDCSLVMLKTRNLRGDRSLSMEEILIDNDLDKTDRNLQANGAPGLKMLQVFLR
ncbi:MAG: hypothetical protein AAFU67_01565 [Bacteroidota bacterium]